MAQTDTVVAYPDINSHASHAADTHGLQSPAQPLGGCIPEDALRVHLHTVRFVCTT